MPSQAIAPNIQVPVGPKVETAPPLIERAVPTPYEKSFDPFGYSSAEATVASSDAQQVDYGFAGIVEKHRTPNNVTGFAPNAGASDAATKDDGTIARNTTPEVTTNDYGTQFLGGPGMPKPGDQVIRSSVKGLRLAHPNQDGAVVTAQHGGVSGGGATGRKQTVIEETPSNDVLATFKNVLAKPVAPGPHLEPLKLQGEEKVPTTYTGQLTTTNAAKVAPGVAPRQLVMIAGVLIVVGLFLKA